MRHQHVERFAVREVVEALVRHRGLTEGLWCLYMEFGIGAMLMDTGTGVRLPTAIVPVEGIGLQRVDTPTSDTVNAAALTRPRARRKAVPEPEGGLGG